MEWIVRTVYKLKKVQPGDRATLFELISADTFTEFVEDQRMINAANTVRIIGNRAAHDGCTTEQKAHYALVCLYNVVGGILLKLKALETLAPFDDTLVPTRARRPRILVPRVQTTPEPQTDDFVRTIPPETVAAAPSVVPDVSWDCISEADTRRLLIDIMLNEAGWDVLQENNAIQPSKACIEIEVEGMPNGQGVGYADYVLFGSDGKPLAVIEAKRTSKDPTVGEQQAILYADCLERRYGVRPVIYFTNGYQTWIIDGSGYPKRRLYAFHSKRDLELLHQQRERKDITDMAVKEEISNRYYQKMAIHNICEHLNSKHRRGLIVMATGAGKTRTAISLVDVLQRAGWVKNVLFLADRTALVNQAHRNFVKLLPNSSTTVLSDKNTNPDLSARITFSTYQTMIKQIDTEAKPYSVGRFDLIIIDEAHRSVFGKYGAIFKYFDSLLIGLTATPRDQVDKSTYDLLQLEGGEPNYAYELEQAVKDGFLVPYVVKRRDSDVMTKGIKYDDLSAAEKDQLEKVWQYEQATSDPDILLQPRDIQSNEIYKYIFNIDTVDKVLQDLMDNGLKVESGEKIGKTIIFAFNSQHAELIVKRFNFLYPQLGPDFCRRIDYKVNYSHDLILRLEQRESLPQIAVTVDMLETGIDVPDILNLVFFKRVRSRIKFMQMIGRGTRLSPDIFGPDKDKEEFYIFDWGGNFEYFGGNAADKDEARIQSLTERIFGVRTDIAYCLQAPEYQQDEFAKGFHDELKATLRGQVVNLPDSYISVREKWDVVCHYRVEEQWQYLKATDVVQLKNEIAPIILATNDNEGAKKFDLLSLYVQLSMVDSSFESEMYERKIAMIANVLCKRASIPAINEQIDLLTRMQLPDFWETKTLMTIEDMRLKVRNLLQYITGEERKTFEVDIEDDVTVGGSMAPTFTAVTYRQKVIEYLTTHVDDPVLRKIQDLEQLTSEDVRELERIMWQELGTKEDYNNFLIRERLTDSCGGSIAAFVRTIIKVNRKHAIELFTQFISENQLTADQEEYLMSILDYVCENGDMQKATLVNEEPFSEIDVMELFHGKFAGVAQFVEKIHETISVA